MNAQEHLESEGLNADDVMPTAQTLRFYNSYESFLLNKPLEGCEIIIKETGKSRKDLKFNKLLVKKDGVEMRIKPKEYPSLLFTDDSGLLHRHFEGNTYLILIAGKYCYYLNAESEGVSTWPNGKFRIQGTPGSGGTPSSGPYINSSFPDPYWSVGIEGPVKVIKDKEFETVCKENGLDKEYEKKKTKRELFMGAKDYGEKQHWVYLEFIKTLNQK